MDSRRYTIIFEGKLAEGVDLETAKAKLQALFKTDRGTVDKLFSGKRTVLKKDVSVEVVKKFQANNFCFSDFVNNQQLLHAEGVLHEPVRAEMLPKIEEEWHTRFSSRAHHDRSATPVDLVEEEALTNDNTISDLTDAQGFVALGKDGACCKQEY